VQMTIAAAVVQMSVGSLADDRVAHSDPFSGSGISRGAFKPAFRPLRMVSRTARAPSVGQFHRSLPPFIAFLAFERGGSGAMCLHLGPEFFGLLGQQAGDFIGGDCELRVAVATDEDGGYFALSTRR
jgi:hypothetical protein